MNDQVDNLKEVDPVGHSQKRDALSLFLYTSISIMFFFSVSNALLFRLYSLALFELIAVGCGFLLLYLLRRPKSYNLVSSIFVFTIAIVFLALALCFKTESSMFIWISIFPIIAFYLLGSKNGLLVHSFFSATLLSFLFFDLHNMEKPPTQRALINLFGTLCASGAFVYYYEYTKNKAIQQIYLLSFLDELTQIGNRKMFNKILCTEKSRSERYNQALSLIMLDIDYFKKINDQFGHIEGDRVLVEFATLLKESIRECDSLFRWGGEEFIIILPNQSVLNACFTANRLKVIVEKHSFENVGELTSSFGVAELGINESVKDFIKRLDGALYEAKAQGRNQVISA